jgi:ribosomal-protein-alanine N-acetyltransferase
MEKAGFVYHHNTVYHKFDGTPVECRSYLLTREVFEHPRPLSHLR